MSNNVCNEEENRLASANIKNYILTHKQFRVPKENMYEPLQVGAIDKEDLGYQKDCEGDNISVLNCYFSELTGFYWIWKNQKDISQEYIGTCHYRRYLCSEDDHIYTEKELISFLQEVDVVTTKKVLLNNSYHFGFAANHNIEVLDMTGEVIRKLYPSYYDSFIQLVNGPETYFGNILIVRKELFFEYCEFLFTIFFEVQRRINLDTDEDAYHKRVFGFISEFLLLVFVTVKGLKVKECKVGMTEEKAETREMKEQLAHYFSKKDIAGAQEYFTRMLSLRPDVLMEASDITGELRLSMQVIATAQQEQQLGYSILDTIQDFGALMKHFTSLNGAVLRSMRGIATESDRQFLEQISVTEVAIEISKLVQKLE